MPGQVLFIANGAKEGPAVPFLYRRQEFVAQPRAPLLVPLVRILQVPLSRSANGDAPMWRPTRS
jgi:hypothetical protein